MSDLVQRLRGIYTVPVNDGAGPLDGKMEHTRQFTPSPINLEAASRIEELEADLQEINNLMKRVQREHQSPIDPRELGDTPASQVDMAILDQQLCNDVKGLSESEAKDYIYRFQKSAPVTAGRYRDYLASLGRIEGKNDDPIEWDFGVPASKVDLVDLRLQIGKLSSLQSLTFVTEFYRRAPVTYERYKDYLIKELLWKLNS